MRRAAGLALGAALASGAAPAQVLVVSPAPRSAAVTVYRDSARAPSADVAADPGGFALVTETRIVTLPAGPAVVRFEGVAGNIFPESAIVSGLPRGARERNLDADLLSPRTLYDRSLGRRVLLRRVDPATGRAVVEQAVIRSGAAGAGVVELRTGVEALRCSGLPEAIRYPAVPAGLSAKPTLSIRVDSPRAGAAAITLAYLAGGFDWRADYTLAMRRDGLADLSAWVTLASSDVTAFRQAEVSAVAGRVNRDPRAGADALRGRYARDDGLRVRCWPVRPDYARAIPPPPPPIMEMLPVPAPMAAMAEDIVVTGSRVAKQEELGDLKLYRFPARVDVASRSQKQVAMLDKRGVPVRVVHRVDVSGGDADAPRLLVRFANRRADGLGLPLPAGAVSVFQAADARPVLVGEVALADKAVGEEVELEMDAGPNVSVEVEDRDPERTPRGEDRHRLTVSNANPFPIRFEARIGVDKDERLRVAPALPRVDGRALWSTTVPAGGRATLDYDVVDGAG